MIPNFSSCLLTEEATASAELTKETILNLLAEGAALIFAAMSPATSGGADAALAARRSWDAMTCAGYATFAKVGEAEEMRLEQLGISEGRKFLKVLRADGISEADFRANVPLAFYGRMGGPSVDFVLGRLWQVAEEQVGDQLWKKGLWSDASQPEAPDESEVKFRAQGLYDTNNCKSLR